MKHEVGPDALSSVLNEPEMHETRESWETTVGSVLTATSFTTGLACMCLFHECVRVTFLVIVSFYILFIIFYPKFFFGNGIFYSY